MQFTTTEDGREVAIVETYGAGMEAGPMLDWFDTFFYALSKLRSSDLHLDRSRDTQTLHNLHTSINDLVHRLEPRLEGLITALIRAHYEAGGSHRELASAMDVARSTASTRVSVTRTSRPTQWEQWARGEMSPNQEKLTAEDVKPGHVMIFGGSGPHEQVQSVDVDGGLVYIKTGRMGDAVFTYHLGDPVHVFVKNPSPTARKY